MRILLVHNRYQRQGGEDAVFEAERDLLRGAGHRVVTLERHNREIEQAPALRRAGLALGTLWAPTGPLRRLLRAERPDVAHFHNTFPLISPSAYHACRAEGVAVVQTLHNFRLLCPNALLFRDGRVCQDCLGRALPWPGVAHGCYRGSRAQSGVVAGMLALHRSLGTWRRQVDTYVALSRHARGLFIRGGLPAERIFVKPNFLTRATGATPVPAGGGALFAGRLDPEKGVDLLLAAWERLPGRTLTVLGDGPLTPLVRRRAAAGGGISFGGWVSQEEVARAVALAAFVVIPSRWFEGLPMLVLSACAAGRPLLAARLGGLAEAVVDGETGLLFAPGHAGDLAQKARRLLENPGETARMGRAARALFERRYTAEAGLRGLMEIYARARSSAPCPAARRPLPPSCNDL